VELAADYNKILVKIRRSKRVDIIILLILFIITLDQLLKFYVKTNFALGDGFNILGLSWAQIKFTENYGMAFGFEFGGKLGKFALGGIRFLAGLVLLYFTYVSALNNKSKWFVFFLAFITAGAIGNIIDGMFYGILFSESTVQDIASFLPQGGGYSVFLDGHVVDMFYFPIIETTWPQWIPILGGQLFEFNRYIFNLADLSITVGVFGIIVLEGFRKKKNS
jgi:signal peptidase II